VEGEEGGSAAAGVVLAASVAEDSSLLRLSCRPFMELVVAGSGVMGSAGGVEVVEELLAVDMQQSSVLVLITVRW
jgi:hypothetical protein